MVFFLCFVVNVVASNESRAIAKWIVKNFVFFSDGRKMPIFFYIFFLFNGFWLIVGKYWYRDFNSSLGIDSKIEIYFLKVFL